MMPDTSSSARPGARLFRAADVATALCTVQSELGPEALIVSVRQVPGGAAWQVWRKPGVEVVAMAAPGTAVREAPHSSEAAPVSSKRSPEAATREGGRVGTSAADASASLPSTAKLTASGYAEKAAQIKSLLTEMAQQRAAAPASGAADSAEPRTAGAAWSDVVAGVERRLASQGLDSDLITRVASLCAETLSPRALADPVRVREHIRLQLEANLRVWGSPALAASRASGSAPRVVCLVGSTGSGKTTTIGKLAALHTRTLGLRVAWVCADTHRAGAIAQARAYAEALKLPLRIAYTGGELAQSVTAEHDADLILVDMPGCNPRREADVVEVGELLADLPARLTYLVAPATAKDGDLMDALAAFKMFDLKGLVLTKLDETATYGDLYNLAWRSRLPVMYFASGPGVLDELEPASAGRLVGALFAAEGRSRN